MAWGGKPDKRDVPEERQCVMSDGLLVDGLRRGREVNRNVVLYPLLEVLAHPQSGIREESRPLQLDVELCLGCLCLPKSTEPEPFLTRLPRLRIASNVHDQVIAIASLANVTSHDLSPKGGAQSADLARLP